MSDNNNWSDGPPDPKKTRTRGPAKKTLEANREKLSRDIQILTASESREIDLIHHLEREIAGLRRSGGPSPELIKTLERVRAVLNGKISMIAELDGACKIIDSKLQPLKVELQRRVFELKEAERGTLDGDMQTARKNEVRLIELNSEEERIKFEIDTIKLHQARYDKKYGEVYKIKLMHDNLESALKSKEAEKERLHSAARNHELEIGRIEQHIQSTGSRNPHLLERERLLMEKQRSTALIQNDKAEKVAEVQRLEQEIYRLGNTSKSGGGGGGKSSSSLSSSLYSPQGFSAHPPPHSYAALAALRGPAGAYDMTVSPYSGGGSSVTTSPFGGGNSMIMTPPTHHNHYGFSSMPQPPPSHYHYNSAMGGGHHSYEQPPGVATAIGYPLTYEQLLQLNPSQPVSYPLSPSSPGAAEGQRSSMQALAAVASREIAAARASPPRAVGYDGSSLLSPGGVPPPQTTGFVWPPPAVVDFGPVGGGQTHYPDTPFTAEMRGLGF